MERWVVGSDGAGDHLAGDTYTDPGATAQDGVDGTMSVEVSHAVDTATYTVSDRQCGQHRDRESNGDDRPDSANGDGHGGGGTSYLDTGASAEDVVDGNLTGTLGTENPINETTIKQPGSYTVTYTSLVVDQDTMAPVITLNGTAAVNQEAGVTYTDLGASAD